MNTDIQTETQSRGCVERLVRPFELGQTAKWRERKETRDALQNLRDACDEALICLDSHPVPPGRLDQATRAIADAEKAIARLWPNIE